jgi:hypothetical protein
MNRTHLSLYYLVSYLTVAGLALFLVPDLALQLLLSNGEYGLVFPRLAGMVLIGLAIIVFQIVRMRVEVMYGTTLIVRLFFLPSFLFLYAISSDPFFLVVFGIVLVGVLWTGWAYLGERRSAP